MKNINKELTLFLEEKFPDVYAAFLTGSAVDEYFNAESDYDVYVITNTRDFVFTESFNYFDMKVQLVHIPLNRVEEILWYDWFCRMGIHLTAFKKAKILIDSNGYLPTLVEACKSIFDQGPPPCSPSEMKSHKIVLSNFISDLTGNKNDDEKVIICHDLYKAFIKFYLDRYRYWNSRHKHLARQMRMSNPALAKRLLTAVRKFHSTLDPNDFLTLIKNEIAIIGDIDEGYSLYSGLIEVKNCYMIMRHALKGDPYKEAVKLRQEALDFYPTSSSTFVFRSRPLGDDDYIDECVYLIVAADTSRQINEHFIPKLNEVTFSNNSYLSFVHYPVNFDFDLFLGGKDLLGSMLEIFHFVSLKYANSLRDASDSIVLSFHFMNIFFESCFNGDVKSWLEFLSFVNNSWISRAYDNKCIHNIGQLIKAKSMTAEIFAKQFDSQRKSLIELSDSVAIEEEDIAIFNSLTKLNELLKSTNFVKLYQMHPVDPNNYNLKSEWVIYRNMLNFILGILMYKDSQKPYLIYSLIEIQQQKSKQNFS